MFLKSFINTALLVVPLFFVGLAHSIPSKSSLEGLDDVLVIDSQKLDRTSLTNSNQNIKWQPCSKPAYKDWFKYDKNLDKIECTILDVPLSQNTRKPLLENTPKSSNKQSSDKSIDIDLISSSQESSGSSFAEGTVLKLAVTRIPATGTDNDKIGTLISVSGGPGQSGINFANADLETYKHLSKYFDLIHYAPRGILPSTPSIKCDVPKNDINSGAKEFVEACWRQTPNDLLSQMGAEYAIEDIEAIRKAIGAQKINLIGYSYGTRVATLYAEKYPENIRSVVLDGLMDLNETDFETRYNQEVAIQAAFERFVEWCRLQPSCFFEDTDSLKSAEVKMSALFGDLEKKIIIDFEGDRIHKHDLSWAITGLLVSSHNWPFLNDILFSIEEDNYYPLKFAISYSKDSLNTDYFTTISCADTAPSKTRKKAYHKQIKLIDRASSWDNYLGHTGYEIFEVCYHWPVTGSNVVHVPKLPDSAPKFLMVAQTLDSATPYINAVAVQKYLDSILITRNDIGHTLALMEVSQCVDDNVIQYLIDPEDFARKAPTKNITCD